LIASPTGGPQFRFCGARAAIRVSDGQHSTKSRAGSPIFAGQVDCADDLKISSPVLEASGAFGRKPPP
jgi:hypothetical protein